jgi:hypothetical protein
MFWDPDLDPTSVLISVRIRLDCLKKLLDFALFVFKAQRILPPKFKLRSSKFCAKKLVLLDLYIFLILCICKSETKLDLDLDPKLQNNFGSGRIRIFHHCLYILLFLYFLPNFSIVDIPFHTGILAPRWGTNIPIFFSQDYNARLLCCWVVVFVCLGGRWTTRRPPYTSWAGRTSLSR